MKLHTLQVEDFRAVHRATVTFGPGLTVLHGPNELGKSTLVEAIHAALFVQSSSQAGNEHVQWGTSTPACVTLTFEHADRLWKVTKRFGPRSSAKLESRECGQSGRFRDVAEGRDVEGRIRDLLAWGIASPGGKGAAPKPESFLLTALVGRQGQVQAVFDASLDKDKDDAGRSLVNQALGALDKDPVVALLIDKLTARVERFFTDQGKLKTAADSPLVQLQNRLRAQQALLATLRSDTAKGQTIQADVVRLQDERERLVTALHEAKEVAAAAEQRRAQREQRAALQRTVDGLRERLGAADALRTRVAELEAQLSRCDARLDTLRADERAAGEQVEQARLQRQAAAENVARAREAVEQSAVVRQSTLEKRRADLARRRSEIELQLTHVRTAEDAAREVARIATALEQARAQREACVVDVARAERVLEQATLHRTLLMLTARQREVDEAAAALAEGRRLEDGARERLQAATERLHETEAGRGHVDADPSSDAIRGAAMELIVLAAAEAQMAIDRLRADVQALEERDQKARQTRAAAKAQRDEATALETRAARRVLPTREQIASWRALEAEVQADASYADPPRSSSPLPAVLACVAAFVVGAAAAQFGFGLPVPLSMGVGVVVGALAGLAVWAWQRSRVAEQSAAIEPRVRRRDRWTQEVQPSLQAAGLASPADYEGAVADLERQKREVERLRGEAAAHDDRAAEFEREAAALDSRRAELNRLERARPVVDEAAMASALTAHGNNVDQVRCRVDAVRRLIETERQRLRAEAGAAVQHADEQRAAAQAEHDVLARQVTAADTTLALKRQQVDEAELARIQTRLREIDGEEAPTATADEAMRALDEAKRAHTAAATEVQGLEKSVGEARRRASERVAGLGDAPEAARGRAEQELAAMAAEWDASQPRDLFDEGAMAAEALDEARGRHSALEAQLTANQLTHHTASASVTACQSERAGLTNDLASVRGQLSGFDVAALTAHLERAVADPVFQRVAGEEQPDPDAAAARVATLHAALDQCIVDLSHAKGQLHLTAGHVGSERLAQQEEAVALADAEVKECERTERAALRLLREIERAENERATHLGRVLADPVSKAFRALTGDRYGQIALASDLKTESIEADGEARPIERMSLGAREQLATLLRLAIAGYLRTALVLDDQLVHSDSGRLAWFNEKLRGSVREHAHQVIVFTCRPGDYLQGDREEGVTAIDLTAVVS